METTNRSPLKTATAAVKLLGKVYTGRMHYEAFDAAVLDGVVEFDTLVEGFVVGSEFLTREQTSERFGFTKSEQLRARQATA